MLKSHSKLILVSVIIFITAITIVIFISTKKSPPSASTPEPTTSQIQPTEFPTTYNLQPTTLPISDFTGAVATQELPTELKSVGEQKTALRRLTPLYLDFAVIEFDYENDIFLVQLLDPIEESKAQFASWRTQTYPSLLEGQFVIY